MSFYVKLQGKDVLEKSLIYAPVPSPPPQKKKFCTNHGESAVQVVSFDGHTIGFKSYREKNFS